MIATPSRALLLALLAASCVSPTRPKDPAHFGPDLVEGQIVAQGLLGVAFFERVEHRGGANPSRSGSVGDLETMPVASGMWQQVFGGEELDWGLEAGLGLGYRNGHDRVDSEHGGGPVEVDVDLLLIDVSGGGFLSMPLGERARIYAGAGPLLQLADYAQEGTDPVSSEEIDREGQGIGIGLYARTGIEVIAPNDVILGFGLRWVESSLSLDDDLGRLEVGGAQLFLTISDGF